MFAGGSWRGALGLILGGLLLAGCAARLDWRDDLAQLGSDERSCLLLLSSIDASVAEADVADAAAARVDGFPYLRINRFLASFRHDLHSPEAFEDWVWRLRDLDAEARGVEISNLPAEKRLAIARRFAEPDLAGAANACGDRLVRHELLNGSAPPREALLSAAEAPSHYRTSARVMGLYPLTGIGIAIGYAHWQGKHLDTFALDYSDTLNHADTPLRRYVPALDDAPEAEAVAEIVRSAPRSPLGIPELDDAALMQLAEHFAPVFDIETRSRDDRPGTPYWRAGAHGVLPAVDVERPLAHVRLAYTRFDGAVLPQIVYTIWFPARPRPHALDLLGGRIDGVVWRITLGENGEPLIHDSIHACGCYHMFFPVPPVRRVAVPADEDIREEPLVPAQAPRLAPGQRLHVSLAAGSHYVTNLGVDEGELPMSRRYALRPVTQPPEYGTRSLELPNGERRSLFDSSGIVPHSERLERFLLWPAGIKSPGAMRQWGTHATAFVGRRHFDDPYLFEQAFER
ncbi:hypothetical protein GCM10007160_14920 [Litchfieldella qijiaojingensis]|uniref:Uncharacterized protein n=1 Tax=Litchfieldella qijiaojingensis TaxID=980347 RepID=A0ABQ2YML1_9GAMM|nr:hypothetical protein [Halomonas qijiaojingensis]GGX88460.1 hypothetical protein GCM10007160_14920 [Halomonas qijiaojingensis]